MENLKLTTKSTAFVGDMYTATCCTTGYPRPIITIKGIDSEVSYSNLTYRSYKGCTTRNIATSNVTAGLNLTTICNVSMTECVCDLYCGRVGQ